MLYNVFLPCLLVQLHMLCHLVWYACRLSVGTAHGFAIVNYITLQLVHAASTLDPAGELLAARLLRMFNVVNIHVS